MDLSCDYLKMKHPIAQKALYALLEVKDSDLRLDTVYPVSYTHLTLPTN